MEQTDGSLCQMDAPEGRDAIPSQGWEDLLEKEMATHFSILAWEIPWTEQPGGLQCMGLQEWDTT